MNSAQNTETKQPLVAVVILNWNGKKFLDRFLPSVLASTYSNKKIIVADNASTDDSVTFVRERFPSVEIIINPSNGGYASGYNTALKNVQADYFVLLNSDVEVEAGWIEPVVSLMENDPLIGACQPKIKNEKQRDHFEYAGAAGGWRDALGYPFARGRVLDTIETDAGQYDPPAECSWATGTAMFVRADVFNRLKGFDDYYFAHQEEIDLCWRMQHAGYKIFAQPASVIYHVGGGTLPKGNSRKTYLNFRNNLITIYKNTHAAKLLYLLPIRVALDGVAAWKGLLSGDGGYFIAILKAHLHFLSWMLFHKKHSVFPEKLSRQKLHGVYNGSILRQYYLRKKKIFSEIVISK